MGLIDWLRDLFRGPTRERRVSSLTSSDDAGFTREVVDTRPVPLKPDHHRMTFRDPKLLPKPEPRRDRWGYPTSKRKRVMDGDTANRLFGGTMRTRNRNIRDLTTDAAQLERYGLPSWESEEELAAALGLGVKQLRHFSIHRDRERNPHYVVFAIRKRQGGHRLIHAPKQRLKAIQRKLHELLVTKLPVSEHAHGFVEGRSVASNARPHVGKSFVVKFDIENCFPSIHFGRVRGLLVALGYGFPVATTLAVLMTEPTRQPVAVGDDVFHVPVGPRFCVQGAPTSPGLCNAILMRLDRRLAGLAGKFGCSYTRYADDLTFSGDDGEAVKTLLHIVPRIVADEGFAVNRKKTQVLRRGRCQRVTGVVVNDTAGLSRTERRRLRAAIHRQQKNGASTEERQRLAGKLAYLHMLNPDQAAPLLEKFRAG